MKKTLNKMIQNKICSQMKTEALSTNINVEASINSKLHRPTDKKISRKKKKTKKSLTVRSTLSLN